MGQEEQKEEDTLKEATVEDSVSRLEPSHDPQARNSSSRANPELIRLSETTFNDVTKEVKMLMSSNWLRFIVSKHYFSLVKNVAQRSSSLWDRSNTTSTIAPPSRKIMTPTVTTSGGFLSPPSQQNPSRNSQPVTGFNNDQYRDVSRSGFGVESSMVVTD